MSRIIEWPLDSGEVVFIEVADEDAGLERVGRAAEAIERAGETLQETMRRITPAITAVVGQVRDAAVTPERITVTFGVKLTVSTGAVIAKSSGEANFEVSVEWGHPRPGASD